MKYFSSYIIKRWNSRWYELLGNVSLNFILRTLTWSRFICIRSRWHWEPEKVAPSVTLLFIAGQPTPATSGDRPLIKKGRIVRVVPENSGEKSTVQKHEATAAKNSPNYKGIFIRTFETEETFFWQFVSLSFVLLELPMQKVCNLFVFRNFSSVIYCCKLPQPYVLLPLPTSNNSVQHIVRSLYEIVAHYSKKVSGVRRFCPRSCCTF